VIILEPRIHNRNGQTIFPKDVSLKSGALIFVEIIVDGSKLYKGVEIPIGGTLADFIKLGWDFGKTAP
jgi:hypothetical protein